jgi:hypothetical protein
MGLSKGKKDDFGGLNNKRAACAALFYIVEVQFPVKVLLRAPVNSL